MSLTTLPYIWHNFWRWKSLEVSALALNENCSETKSIETNFPDGCLDAQGFGVAHQRQDIFSILLAGDHGTAELHHKMQATATELIQHVKAFKPCTLKRRRSDFAKPIAWQGQRNNLKNACRAKCRLTQTSEHKRLHHHTAKTSSSNGFCFLDTVLFVFSSCMPAVGRQCCSNNVPLVCKSRSSPTITVYIAFDTGYS